ncbi:MAG: YbaK/EbsC family protein, partial [Salipiger marinus]|uniref:YbaK/EbsC family protein n=1 Tax=Salipiger marinus TaxID=555512 RepID=UPI004058D624
MPPLVPADASPEPLTSAAVAAALAATGAADLGAELLAEEAAREHIYARALPAKTLALVADESRPVVAVLHEAFKADLRRLRQHLGLGKGALRLATPVECVQVFGYVPGWGGRYIFGYVLLTLPSHNLSSPPPPSPSLSPKEP